jgi:TRAP-type C4-dicarboxylate transport system permease small subunit
MRLPATGLPMSAMVVPVLAGGVLMACATLLHLVADATGRPLPADAANPPPAG